MEAREGYVRVGAHRIWYRSVGSGGIPLLVLHGGPGYPHDYLITLEGLAGEGRHVVFYDQLDCGRSDRPGDPNLWHISYFVDELAAVRAALGLDRIHLLGQSWGGMLALEYALGQPAGLNSLILASTSASMPFWRAEAERLRATLPAGVQEVLRRHEDAGTTDSSAYQEAMIEFHRRYDCRIYPWPDPYKRAEERAGLDVFHAMNGPSDFHITGTLRDWDRTSRLGEIRVPTLITCGRFDEATPAMADALHQGITGSDFTVFEHSAHQAHLEETEHYLRTVEAFLARVEGAMGHGYGSGTSDAGPTSRRHSMGTQRR
jgi:proline-specific peptidase